MSNRLPPIFKPLFPDEYPEARFQFQVNLTNNQIRLIKLGGDYSTKFQELFEELQDLHTKLNNPQTSERQRKAAIRRGKQIEQEVEAEQGRLRREFGALLSQAYGKQRYEFYDLVFDFTTADTALTTIESDDIPEDFKRWLRWAPAHAAETHAELTEKKSPASFALQLTSKS